MRCVTVLNLTTESKCSDVELDDRADFNYGLIKGLGAHLI